MDSKTYRAILKTICYSDVFDYPLTEEEVYKWRKDIKILRYYDIRRANGVIAHKNTFMFLKGRERLVAQRLEREKISKKKLEIAKRIISLLKYIPTIRLVGVSGSVAMNNASNDDDIDLFIIVRTETVWLTRLLSTIVVELFGKRRRPGDTNVADKICLNMFMDENFLSTPKEKQNLYKAHEICQLNVLYDRGDTYQKFVNENRWVSRFLPKAIDTRILRYYDIKWKKSPNIFSSPERKLRLISQSLNILNALTKRIQLWYMRRHQTSEVITDHYLAFHPKDYTDDILTAYRERLSFYGSQV